MAKNRMINTKMWNDNYFISLDPIEKLLFIYFLTNNKTNISGVYEIPLKIAAAETGIDQDAIENILTRFEDSGKMKYENGWVAIKNFIKHQDQRSATVKKGIENELEKAPETLRNWLNDRVCIGYIGGMDTLSYPNPNLNPNSNPNLNGNDDGDSHNCNEDNTKQPSPRKKKTKTKDIEQKTLYLDCVYLKDQEVKTLQNKYGYRNTDIMIEMLNNYKMSSGREYESDYHAINGWVHNEWHKRGHRIDPCDMPKDEL